VWVIADSALSLVQGMAGTLAGPCALLTVAVHSGIDVVASDVAFCAVRKAGEPADEGHRYGHEKIENLSAAIEGVRILVGSAAIAFEAIRHLVGHGKVRIVGLAIAVAGVSMVVNVVVATVIARKARLTDSPALAADAAPLPAALGTAQDAQSRIGACHVGDRFARTIVAVCRHDDFVSDAPLIQVSARLFNGLADALYFVVRGQDQTQTGSIGHELHS